MTNSNFRDNYDRGKMIFNLLMIFLCSIGIYIFIIFNFDSSNYPDMHIIDRITTKHTISDHNVINNITYRTSEKVKINKNNNQVEWPTLLTEVPSGNIFIYT